MIDSRTYRNFCRIGLIHKGFKKSALCKNIKDISSSTWESINRLVIAYADDKKIEKGKEARVDCTVVCSNIHDPSDSSLLWDSVRVLTKTLKKMKEELGISLTFTDHRRRAKRRMPCVLNAKVKKARVKPYKDLLKVTEKTIGYSKSAASVLDSGAFVTDPAKMSLAMAIEKDFKEIIPLTERIVDQTTRRVMHAESVPATDLRLLSPQSGIGWWLCIQG